MSFIYTDLLVLAGWREQTHKSTKLRDMCQQETDLALVFLWKNIEQKSKQVTVTPQTLCQSGMLISSEGQQVQ